MFDFSFGELTICLLVALVVLGPEKLHSVIRSTGRLVGQARSYMRNLTAELERETDLGEMKRQLEETKRMFREQAEEFQDTIKSVQQEVHEVADQASGEMPKFSSKSQGILASFMPMADESTESTQAAESADTLESQALRHENADAADAGASPSAAQSSKSVEAADTKTATAKPDEVNETRPRNQRG